MNDLDFEVRRRFHERDCREAALVLRALGIPHAVRADRDGFVVCVSVEDAPRALHELREYDRETEESSQGIAIPRVRATGWRAAVVFAAVLMLVFSFQYEGAFGMDWDAAGISSAARVRGGEWWRAVTALTLHADVGHLAGNVAIGGIFITLLFRVVGNGAGWALLVLSGTLGNLLNAYLKADGHRSLGASTAVFGVLGALVAWQWTLGQSDRAKGARRWAPIVMGIVLLSYLGVGGERTDVLAHVTGFAAGGVLGYGYGRAVPKWRPGRGTQALLTVAAAGLLVVAWAAALSHA